MAPPQLSADAPISWSFKPLIPDLFELSGVDLEFAVLDNLNHLLRDLVSSDVPLRAKHRLNDIFRPLTGRDRHLIIFFSSVELETLKVLENLVSAIVPLQSLVLPSFSSDAPRVVKNHDCFQFIAHTALKIIRIMSRGDFHCASTEVKINERGIRDNLDHSISDERVLKLKPNHFLVPGVIRVNSDSHITEHRLNTRRGNYYFIEGCVNNNRVVLHLKHLLALLASVLSRHLNSRLNLEVPDFNEASVLRSLEVLVVQHICDLLSLQILINSQLSELLLQFLR